MVDEEYIRECYGCVCSFEEKMSLFYAGVMTRLKQNNNRVINKFNETVETGELETKMDVGEMSTARSMLKCKAHREEIVAVNYIYFRDVLLSNY